MPNEHRPLKVFLCHASQDKSVVRELSRRLVGENWIDTWLDDESLLPGEDWRVKIEEAVEASDIVIICLSNNSVNKEGHVQKELRYAREIALEKPDETIFLIPLRLDDCIVPRGLRFYQWVDYFGEEKNKAYNALITSLKRRHKQKLGLEAERDVDEKTVEDRLKLLEKEAIRFELMGNLWNARRTWYEIKRIDPFFPRVDIKIQELEHEVAENAARERIMRESAKQASDERTERRPSPFFVLKNAFFAFSTSVKSILSRVFPFLKIAGFTGIAIAVVWTSIWAFPKFISLVPTPEATATQRLAMPTKTTKPKPAAPQTRISTPAPTKTRVLTPTATSLPAAITDSKGVPMMFVPAGNFTMGQDDDDFYAYHDPAHTVYLDSFHIDKYEVTNARYKACVDAGACTPPQNFRSRTRTSYYGDAEFDNYPVISVTWSQAKLYCEWRDGSLPTEAQWEKAARGADGRIYPWGEEKIDCNKANANGCEDDSTEVGSYKSGVSPYGLYDMTGNVWEWVADYYSATYYKYSPTSNPLGPNSGQYRVVRGSSSSFLWGFQTYARGDAGYVVSDIGFRCARDASP